MTLMFQTAQSYDDCRKVENNEIEWRLAWSGSDSWESDDLGAVSTSAAVSDLEPGRYEVRLRVGNEGGITIPHLRQSPWSLVWTNKVSLLM